MCVFLRCVYYLQACADVRAGPVFWQQMELRDQLSGEPTLPEWLSTHPSHRNRVAQLDRLIPEVQTHAVFFSLDCFPLNYCVSSQSYVCPNFEVKKSVRPVWGHSPTPFCFSGETVQLQELLERFLMELMKRLERYKSTCRHGEEGRKEGETWGFRKTAKTFCCARAWMSAQLNVLKDLS